MEPKDIQPQHDGLSPQVIVVAVAVFVLIIGGMFGYAYLKKTETATVIPVEQSEDTVDTTPYDSITRVTGKHFYSDGVHTVVGEIPMPTPCDLLEAEAFVAESYPEQITLQFSVINNAEVCQQVVTPARFQVEATASEEATFGARFMDRPVELNLIPAEPGETPDDFELFIKG